MNHCFIVNGYQLINLVVFNLSRILIGPKHIHREFNYRIRSMRMAAVVNNSCRAR